MPTNTFSNWLDSVSSHAVGEKFSTLFDRWRGESEPISALFMRIRDVIDGEQNSSLATTWDQFEQLARQQITVLTPFELSRFFGLESTFESSEYHARETLTRRLRLDCDFPEAELAALAERRRLETMTPAQRANHEEVEKCRRQQEEMIRQQMLQQQQGDVFVSATQARMRAGAPRKMLDRKTVAELQKRLVSQGVDLKSEAALKIEAVDVEEAILFARVLSHARECDFFRGQALEWNPVPGILRMSLGEQLGSDRWQRFKNWAGQQPALDKITRDSKKLAAVGQHYGLPTYLMDFSRNPRVAAFFATHTDIPPTEGPACIYCLSSGALDASYNYASSWMRYYDVVPEVERVEVDGLFRMQAQEGTFVYANQAWWTSDFFRMDAILFPRSGPIDTPLATDIYPAKKSEIEQLVDAYFLNEA